MKQAERQAKEEQVKKLDASIVQLKSEIEKNKNALNEAERYKEFLLNLDLDFAKKRAVDKAERKEKLKKEWIKKMRNLQSNDPMYKVVFTDDEEIHGDVQLQVSGARKSIIPAGTLRPG